MPYDDRRKRQRGGDRECRAETAPTPPPPRAVRPHRHNGLTKRSESIGLLPSELHPVIGYSVARIGIEPRFEQRMVRSGPALLLATKQPGRGGVFPTESRFHRFLLMETRGFAALRRIFPLPPHMKSTSARMPCTSCCSIVSIPTPSRSEVSRVERPSIFLSITTSRHRGGRRSNPSCARYSSSRAVSWRSGVVGKPQRIQIGDVFKRDYLGSFGTIYKMIAGGNV